MFCSFISIQDHLRPRSHPYKRLKAPGCFCPFIHQEETFSERRWTDEESLTGNIFYDKELMENMLVPPLALRGISVNSGSARHRDALRLGMPFHIDTAYLDQGFPCGRLPCLPFLGVCEYSFEPAFIQKRNERERHRVRCVNEGYARLREHLPQEFEDKRLSKVETLRAAIDYIKHLQGLLDVDVSRMEMSFNEARDCERRTECGSDGESKASMSDSGDNVY